MTSLNSRPPRDRAAGPSATPLAVDPSRWPDVAAVPGGFITSVRARIAERLFRRAVSRLRLSVEFPDQTQLGSAPGTITPRLIIRRPQAFARRVGARGLVGFGEAFMAGDWYSDDLVGVLTPFAAQASSLIPPPLQLLRRLAVPRKPADEDNALGNTASHIARHYDLSNDLFAAFLDDTMTYSSALFTTDSGTVPDSSTVPESSAIPRQSWSGLAAAQHRKIDRLLDLAQVGPGCRLLEIGTGWGELSVRAAQRGAQVVSVTLSAEQRQYAMQRVDAAGFRDRVRVDLCDYREITGSFDAVVSVEMIEAVGHKYWPVYFSTIDSLLAPGGRAAIQAITMPHDRMIASRSTYTWIHKYIFPGGELTSLPALTEVIGAHTGLVMTAGTGIGAHYAETLRLWRERFGESHHRVADLGFDTTFMRMWEFYLAYSEAGFRAGYLDVHQLLLTRPEDQR